jgi:hypothetical protein
MRFAKNFQTPPSGRQTGKFSSRSLLRFSSRFFSLGGTKTLHCNGFRVKFPTKMVFFCYASIEASGQAVKTPG